MTTRAAAAPICAVAILAATPVGSFEVHPQDEYVGAATFLGAAGGAALGAALGGLSRPLAGSRVSPFLRWGAVGAGFGAVLGHEIADDAVARARAEPAVSPRPTREAGACVGALLGELAGVGAAAAFGPKVSRNTREVWAGLALGGVVGAGAGFLLRPARALAPPSAVSSKQRTLRNEQERLEPLLPQTLRAEQTVRRGEEGARLRPTPVAPASAGQTVEMATRLLDPETQRLTGVLPPVRHEPVPIILPDLEAPPRAVLVAKSVLILGLLEGSLLGATAGGAAGGGAAGFYERIGIGSALGALAGWSASEALTRTWTDPASSYLDASEALAQGRRTSGVLIGGMLGTLAGAMAGAVAHNAAPSSFSRADLATAALVGNVTGLLAGALLTGRRGARLEDSPGQR